MDNDSLLKSGIKTLLAGISITAAFASAGFIAAFGREQFLGTNLSDWSAQTLTILAGRCAADSFFLALNPAMRHWVLLTIGLVVIGAGVVLLRHCKLPAWVSPASECLLAVPILAWLLVTIVNFDAPTIALRGWVLSPNGADNGLESPLTTAIRQLHPHLSDQSAKQFQSAKSSRGYAKSAISPGTGASASASPGVTRLQNYYFGNQSDGPGALLLEASSNQVADQLRAIGFRPHTRDQARELLYDGYAQAVVACLLALLYLRLSSTRPASKTWSDLVTVVRTGVILAAGVATLLLPFVYGKLIDSTLFPDCHITYLEPSISAPDGKGAMVSGEFPVISRTSDALSLLWVQRESGATQIVEVPTAKIVKLEYGADVDALAKIPHCVEATTVDQGADCQ
jgi:hypothetical protein